MTRRAATAAEPDEEASATSEPEDFEVLSAPSQFPKLDLYRETGDAQVLADSEFNGWEWIVFRLRTADEMTRERTRKQRVFMGKRLGPLDLCEIQSTMGGGVFEIRGRFDGAMRVRLVEELDGPRKPNVVPIPPTLLRAGIDEFPAGAPPVPPPPPANDDLRKLLEAIVQQNQTLVQLLAAGRTSEDRLGLRDVFDLADKMATHSPDRSVLGEVVSAFKAGMELRESAQGRGESSTTERLIEKALPIVERVASQILTARTPVVRIVPRPAGAAGPVPQAAPPAAEPSAASVVEPLPTPPPAQAASEEAAMNYRMTTAIEALARAIENADEPEGFAATLEDILLTDELDMLRTAPDDAVVASLRTSAGGRFPVLEQPVGAAFIGRLLAELRHPSD